MYNRVPYPRENVQPTTWDSLWIYYLVYHMSKRSYLSDQPDIESNQVAVSSLYSKQLSGYLLDNFFFIVKKKQITI